MAKAHDSENSSWMDLSPQKRKRKTPRSDVLVSRPVGRPPLEVFFPNLTNTINRIVTENGYKAHRRRQNETGTCGLNVGHLREQVLQAEPDLARKHPRLGLTTLRHRLEAPSKNFNNATRYKGHVAAKVPCKRNDERKTNEDSHFYSARVRYALEAATKFGEQSMVLSVDNKNKVKVGSTTPAVDRRINIRRIFPLNDAPNYLDHDFPNPGYLITPSGYLEMRSCGGTITTIDEHGRQHYRLPTASSVKVFLRGPQNKCNIQAHINDMLPLITKRVSEGVKFLVLISDGGPDFNPNYLVNQVYLSRLFRKTGLEAMIVTTYCPGHSALNPIEHLWAPLTNAIVGVYLQDKLPGQTLPPCRQSGLSKEQRDSMEKMVFDKAMESLASYWRQVKFSSLPVGVEVVKCGQENGTWNDYEYVYGAVSGPAYKLRQCHDVQDELFYLRSHMDRRYGTVIFSKCLGPCDNCLVPVSDHELLAAVKSFPSPLPSPTLAGHFATFMESLDMPRSEADAHMPSVQEKGLGKCAKCFNYLFSSKKNKADHNRLFHPPGKP